MKAKIYKIVHEDGRLFFGSIIRRPGKKLQCVFGWTNAEDFRGGYTPGEARMIEQECKNNGIKATKVLIKPSHSIE